MLLYGSIHIFTEEIRRHLHKEGVVFEIYGNYGLEPGLELLRVDDVLDNPQTVVPYIGVSGYVALV